MFIGLMNAPLLVSLAGLFLSLGACLLALQDHLNLAIICFMYAGIADLFDGVVARKMSLTEQEQEFGMHIDSLIDVASFGVTPCILLLAFQGTHVATSSPSWRSIWLVP